MAQFNPHGDSGHSGRIAAVCLSGALSWGPECPPARADCTPAFLGSYDTPGEARSVSVVAGIAYIADTQSGLQIVDVSNPTSPSLLGSYDTPHRALDVSVVGDAAYVADDGSGLQIIDVADPAAPVLLGTYSSPSYAYGVSVVGTTAYVADYYTGLQVIDVSNPASPTLLGSFGMPLDQTYGVRVVQSVAYVSYSNYIVDPEFVEYSHLLMIDVSNPSAPVALGFFDTPARVTGVSVVGTTAYVVCSPFSFGFAEGDLFILDVSDPAAPLLLGSYLVGGYDSHHSADAVAVAGSIACVADGTSGELRIIDVSDPGAPSPLGSCSTGNATGVSIAGKVAYVAASYSGMLDIDVGGCMHCSPDLDESGALDLFDFLAFVNMFNAGDLGADFDGNGALDLFDFLAFVNAFNAGC